MRRIGGSRECNFRTAIFRSGENLDVRPIGVESILLMDSAGACALSIVRGHVNRA